MTEHSKPLIKEGLDVLGRPEAIDQAASELLGLARQLLRLRLEDDPLFAVEALLLALIRIAGPFAYGSLSASIPRRISE